MKEGYFHSLNEVVPIPTEVSEVYDIMQERIFEHTGNFQGEGSGWIFKELRYFDIHISNCYMAG